MSDARPTVGPKGGTGTPPRTTHANAANPHADAVLAHLEAGADLQDHYASQVYTQRSDADRKAYQHAARILRLKANEFRLLWGMVWKDYAPRTTETTPETTK